MKLFLLILVIVFLEINPAAGETLSWKDLLPEGRQKNPRIISAEKSLESAKLSYMKAYANLLPQLSAGAGWGKSSSVMSLESLAEGLAAKEEFSYRVSGNISLFTGFRNLSALKKQKAEFLAEKARYRRAVSDAVYNLKTAFAGLLYAQEMVSLSGEILTRTRENSQLVKLRYEAGREDKGAYLRSEADLYQAEYELSRAKRNLKVKQSNLLKELGREDFRVITVTGAFSSAPPEGNPPFGELLLTVPDYLTAKYLVDSAVHNLQYYKSDYYPHVSLRGSSSKAGNSWPPDRDRWNVGLNISYPFFSGGREVLNVKIAGINKTRAQEDFTGSRQEILFNLEDVYNKFVDAVERVKVREKYFRASLERARITRVRYINGLTSYQEWDIVENEFMNSKKSLLDVENNAFIAGAAWRRLLGEEE